jgi:hypothetical protein
VHSVMELVNATVADPCLVLLDKLVELIGPLATKTAPLTAKLVIQIPLGLLFTDMRVYPAGRQSRINALGSILGFGCGIVPGAAEDHPFAIAVKQQDA